MDSSTRLGLFSAFSMITVKGNVAETEQVYVSAENGGKANLAKCLQNCDP